MKINLVTTHHLYDEVAIGHKMFFRAMPQCDTISATANVNGFTVLNAVARRFDWNTAQLRKDVDRANNERKVACLKDYSPRLILVPKLSGDNAEEGARYISEFFKASQSIRSLAVQFTHFSFLSRVSHIEVIHLLFESLTAPRVDTTIERLYFEVDARPAVQNILRNIAGRFGVTTIDTPI